MSKTYYIPEDFVFANTDDCMREFPEQAVTMLQGIEPLKDFTLEAKINKLQNQLDIARKAISREVGYRKIVYCTGDGKDNLKTALEQIGGD